MSVGSTYKTSQEVPVPVIYRCEQCESARKINNMPLSKEDNFPPCKRCIADGRHGGSTFRLIEIVK